MISKKRILIPMLILALVYTGAVLFPSILIFNRKLNDSMHERVLIASAVAGNEINNLKTRAHITAVGIANNHDLIQSISNNDHSKMEKTANTLIDISKIDFLMILDAEGSLLICTHDDDIYSYNMANLPHVKAAFAGEIRSYIVPGNSIRLGVKAGTPVLCDNGDIAGIVLVGFRLDTQDFVYNIKGITSCETAVFLDNIIISTTVRNRDGTYAVGDEAPEGVKEIMLTTEMPYTRRMQLSGRDALTKYIPIHGANNEVIGMIGAGYFTENDTIKLWFFAINGVLIMFVVLAACFLPANSYAGTVNNRLESMNIDIRDIREQLEYSSRAKSEFLSRMSHEMKTPLAAIIGTIELAKIQDFPEKVRKYFNGIDIASHQLLSLIDNVLDISSMEYGAFNLSCKVFNFNKMSQNALQEINHIASEKKQKITSKIEPQIPTFLLGDENCLKKVITCLLANSVKFTPEHGEIGFHARLLDQNMDNGEITLQIEIADNGIGIPKKYQYKLFEIFEQTDGSLSRKYGGIGIGLPLSKRIIEMMGGNIWVESEPEKGAKFTFTCKLKYPENSGRAGFLIPS